MGPHPLHADPRDGLGLLQVVLDFTEQVTPALFFACLQGVADRHPTLGRIFGPSSLTHRAIVPTGVLDWCHLDGGAIEQRFEIVLAEDRERGFDPGAAPLLRAQCVMMPAGCSRILITYHHLILDGIARDAMLTELINSYDSHRLGRPYAPRLPRAPGAEPATVAGAKSYWQNALAGLTTGTPISRTQQAADTPWAIQSTLRLSLPAETLAGLLKAATGFGSSLAMVVYAAWAMCLHRFSHEDDIAFLAIRNLRAGTGLPRGPHLRSLVNSVPLRVRVDRDQTVADLVGSVAAFWTAARPYAGAGLAHILAWCGQAERRWDTNILFQRERFAGWFAATADSGAQRHIRILQHSDTPLTVAVRHGAMLNIDLQYWTGSFQPGAIATLGESLAALLGGIAETPDVLVGDLPYLGVRQRAWIEAAAKGPAMPESGCPLLHAGFLSQAARHPESVALICDDAQTRYGDLARAANALAHTLVAAGVRQEEPVAILAARGAEYLTAVLAVLQAGAAFIILSVSHPDAELRRVAQAAAARRCITTPDLAMRAAGLDCDIVVLEPGLLGERARSGPAVSIDPDQLAYLIATSGTSGLPKIVEVPHYAAANTLRHSLRALYAEGDLDLVPWVGSSAADSSIHQIFAPLSAGGTLVRILNLGRLKTSPQSRAYTAFGATPSMLIALLTADALPPRLRAVMFGGEACPGSLPARLATTTIQRAINVYGPTEATIYCTSDDVLAPAASTVRNIGRPIANMRVDLLDERLQPVLPGALGEICISGVGLARGYRGRPDLTAAAFPVVAAADGKRRRIYRSGDLAALLPDGRLEFHGRRDRQVKIRGVRVELDAVQDALARLSGVREAVAAMRFAENGERRLVAWVVATTGSAGTEAELQGRLKIAVPAQMVPDAIVFLDELPLSAAGKPDMAALPDALPALPPTPALASARPGLPTLVAGVLKLPDDAISENSTIYNTVGWDSIRHIMIMMAIEESYGVELSDQDIAAATSIPSMREILHARGVPDFAEMGA